MNSLACHFLKILHFRHPMNLKIIFFIPNIIDYVRILLLFASVFLTGGKFAATYALSVSLDYFDGYSARALNQTSILGGILDMVIDRVSTMLILSKIAVEQKAYSTWCLLYSIIDFIAHFVFFLASVYSGTSHKKMSDNIFMSIYYNQSFLYFVCFGSELCFILTYCAGHSKEMHSSEKSKARILSFLQAIAALKTFFHVAHFLVGVSVMSDVKKVLP